jgi:hypothetical protein
VAAQVSAAGTCIGHSASYWAAAMKGQDFRTEDRLDTASFNSALWRGLGDGAEPMVRDGQDLRPDRLARVVTPARCAYR